MPDQDYAVQRYYTADAGRFYTPDPSTGVDPRNPITWNKYVYASDDPINRGDPSGLEDCGVEGGTPCSIHQLPGGCLWDPSGAILCPPQPGSPGCDAAARKQGLCDYPDPVANKYGPPSGLQFAGFTQALSALGKPQCATVIAGASGQNTLQLSTDLFTAQVTVGTSQPGNTPVQVTVNPDGTYRYTYQWAYSSGGDIELNGNYFPDPTQQNVMLPDGTTSFLGLVNRTLGSSLNAQQLGTLVFLHELSHIADSGNTNQSTIDTNTYNQSIITTCIN